MPSSLWDSVEPKSTGLPPTQNLRIQSLRAIISPAQLTADIPMTPTAHATVTRGRRDIQHVLRREDPRMLVVVGPCSVHDPDAAREYAERLSKLARRVSDRYLIVMRVYFEKPRTTVGWKGLINDPHLDGSFDIETGLRLGRQLLRDVCELGLPTATELLDPVVPQYLDDFLAWAAIGARTTESQTHRQMASGLSMPVGFKNSTDGNLQVAVDALASAMHPHAFLGIDDDGCVALVKTMGNQDGHVILRGGGGKTNFDPSTVAEAAVLLDRAKLPRRLMIDCSHANSSKKHENQIAVWNSVIEQRKDPNSPIVGVMIESNLLPGRQDLTSDKSHLKRGISITDACIGWDETEALLTRA
jgi:3-deoxy-7-phosphoheptulonate synthase